MTKKRLLKNEAKGISETAQKHFGFDTFNYQTCQLIIERSLYNQFEELVISCYVTDEIGRQAQIMQNQLGAQAINAGAFGGGREGVQQAELQGRALSAMGTANQQGFNTALGAAQNQQRTGLAAGQQLGQMGMGQQQMAQQEMMKKRR